MIKEHKSNYQKVKILPYQIFTLFILLIGGEDDEFLLKISFNFTK